MAAMDATHKGKMEVEAHLPLTSQYGPESPLLKGSRSLPDHNRRHSLPPPFLPPSLWSANTSKASLVATEAAARGEHILDEATVAHRISALRQLNGATRSRHRYAKSTGARNSTFSQPVIVRTYSGTRTQSRQREPLARKTAPQTTGEAKLPPVEAFSFKGIMDSIQSSVADDLERIAEICARSRYSLSNQYDVHMPPHGEGEAFTQVTTHGRAYGPTLEAIASDDEGSRHSMRSSRGGARRTKSAAYGTLETIMSSSRSSEEEKSKRKSAAVIAEEVRGRAARKASRPAEALEIGGEHERADTPEGSEPQPRQIRPRSATFASIVLESTHGNKGESSTSIKKPVSLVSEPALPQTSLTEERAESFEREPEVSFATAAVSARSLKRVGSKTSTLKGDAVSGPSSFGGFASWFHWSRNAEQLQEATAERLRSTSFAEGSLREILHGTEGDKKGKDLSRG